MAELKKNFLKGKMNKDFDERLVPNGEYRDALNVEILSSEGSNAGTVQTLRGNKRVDHINFSSNATSVGCITDEENNLFYSFIANTYDLTVPDANGAIVGNKCDTIFQYKQAEDGTIIEEEQKVVINDMYLTQRIPDTFTAVAGTATTITGLPKVANQFRLTNGGFADEPTYVTAGVRVGMRVQKIDVNGDDLWYPNDVRVINIGADASQVEITPIITNDMANAADASYTQADINAGTVIRFTSDRILRFAEGTKETATTVADTGKVSFTPSLDGNSTIITGINIVGDFLLYTDGRNEPKKININRGILGSSRIAEHTRLWVPQIESKPLKGFLKEEHINVIRKTPSVAPKIKPYNTARAGLNSTVVKRRNASDLTQPAAAFTLANANGVLTESGVQQMWFEFANTNVSWQEGDKIKLVGLSSGGVVYFQYMNEYNAGTYETYPNARLFLQVSTPTGYTGSEPPEVWLASLEIEDTKSMFEDKFVHFAYRYKYTDGEYSVISPYSTSAFIPSSYVYGAGNGFNEGMVNATRFVDVLDFVAPSTPEDVIGIEIIARDVNDSARSAWRVQYVDVNDNQYSIVNTIGSNFSGKVEVNDNSFGGALPTDQLLRDQDFVPRLARAQEITGSKVVYGNYVQNFDLKDANVIVGVDSITPFYNSNFNSSNNLLATQSEPIDVFTDDTTYKEGPIRTDVENVDQGNNFTSTAGNYYYTAPAAGTYNITGKTSLLLYKVIEGTAYTPYPDNGQFYWYIPQVTLRLKDKDTGNIINATVQSGSPLPQFVYSTQQQGEALATALTNYTPSNYRDIEYSWSVDLTANQKVQVIVDVSEFDNFSESVMPTTMFSSTTDGSLTTSVTNTYATGVGTATFTPVRWANVGNYFGSIKDSEYRVTGSHSSVNSVVVTQGYKSVKSSKTYQAGVLYTDGNRQSVVMTGEYSRHETDVEAAKEVNRIVCSVATTAPSWATNYKYLIKESENKNYNLVMDSAFANNDGTYAWLLFNSSDIDKVEKNDFLILKKKHNSTIPVTDKEARFKILDIEEETPTNESGESPIIADSTQTSGRFFVKVDLSNKFVEYLGDPADGTGNLNSSANGAVFTTDKAGAFYDSGIYYEASDSHPIKLDKNTAEDYIPVGSTLEVYGTNGIGASILSSITSQINGRVVTRVEGASTFSRTQILARTGTDAFCRIYSDYTFTNILNGTNSAGEPTFQSNIKVIIKVNRPDGTFVTVSLEKGLNSDNKLHVNPYTHPVIGFSNLKLPSSLNFYNCITFGNGVESESIRDEFSSDKMHVYGSTGKISGFKASIENEDYREEHKKNFLINSESYFSKNGVNNINQFLILNSIEREIDENYGSVQKIFLRETNLIIFCEKRVLRILAGKQEFLLADGTSDIISANRVLGSEIAYAGGEYGISKNPESFAINEQKIYFTDTSKGAVLRLSRDGITVISEYGMKDYFYDNLVNCGAAIGSYDGKKDEYNLTIHQVTHPYFTKNVNTVSFDEPANGWVSFKSFVPEQAFTINNRYYTIKGGRVWLHHDSSVDRNTFYNLHTDSTVTPIFNDAADSVKSFRTMSYEGSTSKSADGNTKGWYVEEIKTNLQTGKIDYFLDKEGKFFNYIKGDATSFTNYADGGAAGTTGNNIDAKEISVQGIGNLSEDPTVTSGSTPSLGHEITVQIDDSEFYTSPGFFYLNQTNTTSGVLGTFVISPKPGCSISATDFSTIDITEYLITPISTIEFTDQGTAGDPSNTVLVTINCIAQTLTQDLNISINDFDGINIQQANSLIRIGFTTYLDGTVSSSGVDVENMSLSNISPFVTSTLAINNDSMVRYNINGTIPENANTLLATVNISVADQDGYYYGDNGLPEPILTSADNNVGIAAQTTIYAENVTLNDNGLAIGKSFNIAFNPNALYGTNGNIYSVDQYLIAWQNQTLLRSTVSVPTPIVIKDNTASTYVIPITSTNGPPTATESISWLTVDSISSSQIVITLTLNSGAARNGVITLAPSYQTGNTATLTVYQQSANYIEIL